MYYCHLHFSSSADEVSLTLVPVGVELVILSGKSFGHAMGGSRSEFGFIGVFIPCRLQHGSWSRQKLSTVSCLRRSEVVVLKYVTTLNGFMFLYVLWPKRLFIKQTVAIALYSK